MNVLKLLPLSLVLAAGPAAAGTPDEDIDALRGQIQAFTAKLDELEARQAESERVEAMRRENGSREILEGITLGGDLRYQFDTYDDARRDDDRERHQVRIRTEIAAQVNDRVRVGVGLATGGGSPVNGNQALGDADSPKDLNLDLAYFEWRLHDNVALIGGKFRNPLYRAGKYPLMWDGELRPEGAAVVFDNGRSFTNTSVNFLESDSGANGSGDTEAIYSAQFGRRVGLGDATTLTVGSGFVYAPIAGSSSSLDARCDGASGHCFGNTLDAEGRYAYDYEIVETFAELRTAVRGVPVTLFGDLVRNLEADDHGDGYSLGFKLSTPGVLGDWDVGYAYQDLEADAVFGAFSDSVFAGGGTDNSGHLFSVGLSPLPQMQFAAVYYLTEYGGTTRDRAYDYDRLQLELNLDF